MAHSPYLNHTASFSTAHSQGFDDPYAKARPHYMNYRTRLMEDQLATQDASDTQSQPVMITSLNIISAGLCIAAFGLGVAWFGWPERLTPIFEELGVSKQPAQEPLNIPAPTEKPVVSEGYYTAQIESDTLLIPGTHLRHIHRDDAGIARRIDLLSVIPAKAEASPSSAILPSQERDKIFISLSRSGTTLTPEKRLETTYKHHLADEGATTSLGLTLYRFQQDTGYGDQELYTGILPDGPYVSVCFDEMAGLNASRCLASVNIGQNLVARYNFDRSHIKDWQQINVTVREKVRQMIVR